MSITRVTAAPSTSDSGTTVSKDEHDQVVEKLRQCQDEKLDIIRDHGNLIKEFNKRMHVHIEEIRLLKEVNHKVQADMQELRDLCCYLDDDRHKCRKLAREWQRFGRYTANVMRIEVCDYQEKLGVLEVKENELSTDNFELKELCLYLDKQRDSLIQNGISTKGENSSTTTNGTDEVFRDNGVGYSEKLEARLSSIGLERLNTLPKPQDSYMNDRGNKKRVSFTFPEDVDTDTDSADSFSKSTFPGANGYRDSSHPGILRNRLKQLPRKGKLPFPDSSKMTPEAVAQAMKVLEIHDKLENQPQTSSEKEERLDENEVTVLKEMCNVVWRKLSNGNTAENTKVNGHDKEEEDEVLEDLL